MNRKHLAAFGIVPVPPSQGTLEFLEAFDDRTLASLAGTNRMPPLSDGVDNDDPYRALPLRRWDDRRIRE